MKPDLGDITVADFTRQLDAAAARAQGRARGRRQSCARCR